MDSGRQKPEGGRAGEGEGGEGREGEKCDYEVLDRRCRRSATNSVKTNPLRMIAEHNTEEWVGGNVLEGRKQGRGTRSRRPASHAGRADMIQAQKRWRNKLNYDATRSMDERARAPGRMPRRHP